MSTNQTRILTTHVGSLVRPPKLVAFLEEIEAGRTYDEAAHGACLQESIAEVVRQQANAGVDIVSDGEFGKTNNWAWYVRQRISGFAERPSTPEERKTLWQPPAWDATSRSFRNFTPSIFPRRDSALDPPR